MQAQNKIMMRQLQPPLQSGVDHKDENNEQKQVEQQMDIFKEDVNNMKLAVDIIQRQEEIKNKHSNS